jgi:hypothetical protein
LNWVYLATAPDQLVAEMWRDLLNDRDIPVIIRSGDVSTFLGVTAYPCRLLVDENSRDRAIQILREEMGIQQDAP